MQYIIIPALFIALGILACLYAARLILTGPGLDPAAAVLLIIGLLITVLWGHRLAREFFHLNN